MYCTNGRLLVKSWFSHLTLLQSHSSAAWICCHTAPPAPELPAWLPRALSHQPRRRVLQTELWHLHGSRRRGISAQRTTPLLIPWDSACEGNAAFASRGKGCDRTWPLHTVGAHRHLSGSHNHSKSLKNAQYNFLFKCLSFRSCSSKKI